MTTSPTATDVGPDRHHLTADQSEHIAGLAAPGRGQRFPLGYRDLGPPRAGRGFGHVDDVVLEAAVRIVNGHRGQALDR